MSEPGPTPEPIEEAERVLAGTRVRRSGLVVGVHHRGRTQVWHRGDVPDGPASLFEIGSVTKTFTALLLADLAREGLVGLDDPAADHLPAAPPVRGRPVTLEDLATHHSGLPSLPRGMLWPALTSHRHDPWAWLDEEALAAAIPRTRPKRAPGRRFAYSNYGVGLLGWALARAAGTSWTDLVAARVTGPLGLVDTTVEVPGDARHRLAAGHDRRGREAEPWHLAAVVPAGGLHSSAPDLLRYLGVFAETATGPLAQAAAETARIRHHLGKLGVGLGWIVVPGEEGPRQFRVPHHVLSHEGGTGGHRSFVAVVPATGTAVVVLANQARGVGGLGARLTKALVRGDAD